METRNVKVTLEQAREWYNSGNESLKKIALQAFNVTELENDYKNIKGVSDALAAIPSWEAFGLETAFKHLGHGMYERVVLSLVAKVMNKGYNMNEEGFRPYYPLIFLLTREEYETNKDGNPLPEKEDVIEVTIRGKEYVLFGGGAYKSDNALSLITNLKMINSSSFVFGNLGNFMACATEEIARHMSIHFTMDIFEAFYCGWLNYHFGWKKKTSDKEWWNNPCEQEK